MAVFFVVVLEIKREVLEGELSSPARRRLPAPAAVGGTGGAPADLPPWCRPRPPAQRGRAIPAATDIAFAVGTLALLGSLPSAPVDYAVPRPAKPLKAQSSPD
jgi:NhaA family Na+:H+ antiporter